MYAGHRIEGPLSRMWTQVLPNNTAYSSRQVKRQPAAQR